MGRIIDLTHPLNNNIPVYPGTESPLFKQTFHIQQHGFTETKINMLTHHGTHIDAPAHMVLNGKTLDKFQADKYYGSALCINCNYLRNGIIDLKFLEPFEEKIKLNDFLLLNTRWSEKWGTEAYYSNFPVLSKQACEWLSNFTLKGIGIDNISLDTIDSKNFENHFIVFEKEMIIIENLTNLNQLEDTEFILSCFPLKIENADGSPVRAVAIL
jgi:kynurenine formamidase